MRAPRSTAAVTYSGIIFSGMVLIWIFSALASIIRGTGNMLVPGLVICGGLVLLIPLSPCLIFGFGPIPAMGIAGGGIALLIYYALGTLVLGWYIASGRNLARFRVVRLRWALGREILAVGAVGAVNTLQLNVTIAGAMALVAAHSSAASVAGLGTGTRLEYLLAPLGFGLGAPLVALVGTNIGAGQGRRALRIALIGGALAFALTEAIGIAAAIWPEAWLRLFETDPEVLATGSAYLRTVGPFFGFFGLGITVYFACQGAGRLGWPLLGGLLRVVTVLGGGWIVLQLTGSLQAFFAVYGAGLAVYWPRPSRSRWRAAAGSGARLRAHRPTWNIAVCPAWAPRSERYPRGVDLRQAMAGSHQWSNRKFASMTAPPMSR